MQGSAPHYALRVVFANEHVEGEVGPYRQFFTDVARELHRGVGGLFMPVPNAVAQLGDGRDRIVPRPMARGRRARRCFELVGRLVGCALRTGVLLPLALPSLCWRALLDRNVTNSMTHDEALAAIVEFDVAFARQIAYLTDVAASGDALEVEFFFCLMLFVYRYISNEKQN